jgi:hypothetical protein
LKSRASLEKPAGERWITLARVAAYPKLALAIYAAMAVLWIALSHDFVDLEGKPLGADFITYYAAADLARHGKLADAYDLPTIAAAERAIVPASERVFPWQYPPSFALLLLPLALIPYGAALIVFMSATAAAYLRAIYRVLPDRRAIWAALGFSAGFVNALGGQNGFLSAALFGAGLLLIEARPVIAGCLIGLLTYKPQLGLLIPFVLAAGGYWRVIAVAAVGAVIFALAALLAFGIESWQAFWNHVPVASDYLQTGALPWEKMVSIFAAARLLGAGVTLAAVLHGTVALAVAAICVREWARDGDLRLRVALAAVGTTLLSPFLFDYDLVLLALPIAILAADGLDFGWMAGLRTLLVVVWVAPVLAAPIAQFAALPTMPPVLLALFAACYWRLVSARQASARQPS